MEEKRRNRDISAIDLYTVWHDDAEQRAYEVCGCQKSFNFKNPFWRTAAIVKTETSQYLMIVKMFYLILRRFGRPPSWIFKLIF